MISSLPVRNRSRQIRLPSFFPDATQGVVRTLDSHDILQTGTEGILVNTYHLFRHFGENLSPYNSVRELMNWPGAVISDSGGFQIMSLIQKKQKGKITAEGAWFQPDNKPKILFTPELSLQVQFELGADLMVAFDHFTPFGADLKTSQETVDHTLSWAKRSKDEFDRQCRKRKLKIKPKLIAVVQGGRFKKLRQACAQGLVKIGFDGLGYGGWPITSRGTFDIQTARKIAMAAPKNYLLYGLGIGKPGDIVRCVKIGYAIFDCVLPTRDARHRRLYVFRGTNPKKPNVFTKNFYSCLNLKRKKFLEEKEPPSKNCSCQLCRNYTLGYLAHLFRIKDQTAARLSTIHNLTFYSQLMKALR